MMESFGDVEEEPFTFLATRLFAGVVAMVVLGTAVFGDPLWLSLSFGVAVGGAFAGTAFVIRRLFG